MADYTIDKFSYGGNTYNIDKDIFLIEATAVENGTNDDGSTTFYTLSNISKTYSEVTAAYNANKTLILRINFGGTFNIDHYLSQHGVYDDSLLLYFFYASGGINTSSFNLSLFNSTITGEGSAFSKTIEDKYVDVTLATTTKAYVLGTSTTPTFSDTAVTAIADTGVYLDTTAGRLTATSFSGSGAALTSINASNISSGTIPAARINGAAITSFNASNISTGTIPAARVCGSTLSAINASNLSTGTLPNARLAASGATAGSYGPSSDIAPNAGSNFSVPYVTVDTYGRVTAAVTRNITMPKGLQYTEVDSGSAPPISISGGGTNATTTAQAILNLGIYPIGSIYISVSSTFNPATAFGGTWERIEDTFLLAAGSTYAGGSTGGSATVTLTEEQMPSHTHFQQFQSDTDYVGIHVKNYNSGGSIQGVQPSNGTRRNNIAAPGVRISTVSAGGSAAHENMPPYLAVYVWKRTA